MFGRRILAAVALVAASVHAQLAITNPSPSSWWVQDSKNTLVWTCNTSPHSSFTVVVFNSNKTITPAPIAWISNVPNFDCSFTINEQQSSLAPSTTWSVQLTNPVNLTDVYASANFEVKASGSPYPTTSAGSSGTATGTAGSASSTDTSGKKNGAFTNAVPIGMSMTAALLLGLVVA